MIGITLGPFLILTDLLPAPVGTAIFLVVVLPGAIAGMIGYAIEDYRWKHRQENPGKIDQRAAFIARREQQLRLCQHQCCKVQDAEGLLPIEDIGRILNWGVYKERDGTVCYRCWGTICSEDLDFYCYADGAGLDDLNPFPLQVRRGFFRASDVLEWIEEELRNSVDAEKRAAWYFP